MNYPVQGAGLGFRRDSLAELEQRANGAFHDMPEFMEIAPENWISLGGQYAKRLRWFTERYPFICHGLSLNIGGFAPLDDVFLKQLKTFLKTHQIVCYSEHLSYCADDGHLYDLMPIPFTEEAVKHVSERIKHVQDVLEQPIIMENVSYYAAPGKAMDEIDFLKAVLEEADCGLLLDVNNIYVNSVNHGYDAEEFLRAIPGERIAYGHIAGHYNEAEDLIVDTHGSDVIDPVWRLQDKAYEIFGAYPTLLERDFNIPPVAEMMDEVQIIRRIQSRHSEETRHARRA